MTDEATTPATRKGITRYGPANGVPRFLSDVIIELGLADVAAVDQAVEAARAGGETVAAVLVRMGVLTEDQLARAIAARYGLDHVDLNEFEVDPSAANLLPPAAAQRYHALPIRFEADGSLLVAFADPSDALALSDIAFMTKLDVSPAVASADLVSVLIQKLPMRIPPGSEQASPFAGTPAPTAPPPQTSTLEAQPDEGAAAIDAERTEHSGDAADAGALARDEELEAAKAEASTRAEELEAARAEAATLAEELEATKAGAAAHAEELEEARRELVDRHGRLEAAEADSSALRQELEAARAGTSALRAELDAARSEARERAEGLASAEAAASSAAERVEIAERRAQEAEARADGLAGAERLANEAREMIGKLRHEFELEREAYAANERDLGNKLAAAVEETERVHRAAERVAAQIASTADELSAALGGDPADAETLIYEPEPYVD